MTTRKPPLPVEDHVQLGNRLKDARATIASLLFKFAETARPTRDVCRALYAIDQLRCTLDSLLHKCVPRNRDPRNLTNTVYYGDVRFGLRWYDLEELEHDAFAIWGPVPRRQAGTCTKPHPLPGDC